jgi:hypothetical protein
MFFFPTFSSCSESGNQPQENLAKSGSFFKKEVKNLGILLHVGESLEPISQIWRFQKKES